MPRLTKIYTRKGDDGTTSLGSRRRISKDSPRVEAYGTVDELNTVIGVARAQGVTARLEEVLSVIQNELFHLGADLAFPEGSKGKSEVPHISKRHVEKLEKLIDEFNQKVGPLENFILPGGSVSSAYLHLARTVCRRAERKTVALSGQEVIGEFVLPYLNRLSDALFMMARFENQHRGISEPLWDPTI